VLLTTETVSAIDALARHVARRFELSTVAICLPTTMAGAFIRAVLASSVSRRRAWMTALAKARGALEFDAYQRAYGGHTRAGANHEVTLVPLRHGTRAVGLLAAASPALDIGTLDAVAGVVAIAIERTQFLEERDAAELVRQKADLAATLLAALSHDLKTPLTAIRVAVENLRGDLPGEERKARPAPQRQSSIASRASSRTFWTWHGSMPQPSGRSAVGGRADVVDAATAHVRHTLQGRSVRVDADADLEVEIDPRLASVALSHLLENAAQYSPSDREIDVHARVEHDGLHVSVTDHGRASTRASWTTVRAVLPRRAARRASFGTGMGLSITRGLLGGRRRTGVG
jgi:two-component system sensor histidine kinase KdpD